MTRKKQFSVGAIVAIVALFGSALMGTAQAQKKKKGGKSSVTVTNNTPQPIPEAVGGYVAQPAPSTPDFRTLAWGQTSKTLTVSKKFKGTVGRVALTVSAASGGGGTDTMRQFLLRLQAPDGTTQNLIGGLSGLALGPLTIQSNSPNGLCVAEGAPFVPPPPPCEDPNDIIVPPYQGIVGDAGLEDFAGAKAKGAWKVTAFDTSAANVSPVAPDVAQPVQTNILNGVSLKITKQKPVV